MQRSLPLTRSHGGLQRKGGDIEIRNQKSEIRYQISVWGLVICYASNIIGYDRSRAELSNAPLSIK